MSFPARTTTAEIELGTTLQPKFGSDGLIPCITQDIATGQVLMFAFMNAESLQHTLATKKATYWSRSRNKLWCKGEESGNGRTNRRGQRVLPQRIQELLLPPARQPRLRRIGHEFQAQHHLGTAL
jgi:phosphoribosyl-AMP cyclohydrolase